MSCTLLYYKCTLSTHEIGCKSNTHTVDFSSGKRHLKLEEQRGAIDDALDGLAALQRDAEAQLARRGLRPFRERSNEGSA